jgi:LPXTG-motif cell wall-anchored protein
MDLVTAGEATDGEMQYALGDDATNAPATGWSKSIPQGNDAKPYYVWYRATGDKDHSNSAKNCVTVNIKKANATVTADAQTVKESEDPKFSKDYAILSGAASGHSLGNVTITASGDKLVPSAATIVNGTGEDVTANYNVSYSNGELTVLHKISIKVTFSVVNGEWDNGGSDDIEVVFSGYEGDSFKLALDQIPACGTKPAASYKQGAWDKTPDTDTEITGDTKYVYTYAEDPVYTVTVEGDNFVPGSGKDMVITVKCSINDSQTFSKFVSAKVDGSDLSDENCEKAPGSLILTIRSAYLDTLSTGSHNIEITFADGTATAAINIAKAPAPVPKTGETDSPFTFIGIMMLLAGVLGVLFEIRASRAPRRKVRQAPRAHGHRTREDE